MVPRAAARDRSRLDLASDRNGNAADRRCIIHRARHHSGFPMGPGSSSTAPGVAGYAAAMLLVLAILALFVAGLSLAGRQIASGASEYLPQIQQQLERSGAAGMLGGGQQLGEMVRSAASYLASALQMAGQALAGIVLIFFLVLLMLIEGADWRAKLAAGFGGREKGKWEDAAKAVGQQFRRYFLTRLLLGTMTGVL